jgi:hypothetical protein
MNHRLEDLPDSLARLAGLAERAGRTVPVEVTLSGEITRPDDVERYAQAGVTRLIVRPWSRSREALDGIRRFADQVIGPLQAPPPVTAAHGSMRSSTASGAKE